MPYKMSDLTPAPGGGSGSDRVEVLASGNNHYLTLDQIAALAPPGAPGADGADGADGAAASFQGADTWANVNGIGSPAKGDLWVLTGDDAGAPNRPGGTGGLAGDAVSWSGSAWVNIGSITGPTGAAGPPGAAGAPGAAGTPGAAGPAGAAGVGVPAGGAGGYVLGKASAASYDTVWIPIDSTGGGGDPGGDVPPQPGLILAFHDNVTSTSINVPAGADRRIIVGVHFEQGGQSVTGCLAGAYSMTPLTPAVNGDNGLYAFVLEEAEFPIPSELTNLIISPQYATAPLTNHQLMVLVIEGASGDPSTTQGSASNSNTVPADITTAADGDIVVSLVGVGNQVNVTTTYGDSQTSLADDSSRSNYTVELASGVAGVQSIDWASTGTNFNRLVWQTIRFTAANPAPDEPTIPGGSTTIWDTPISNDATFVDAELGTTATHNGNTSSMAVQFEYVWAHQHANANPDVTIWQCGAHPNDLPALPGPNGVILTGSHGAPVNNFGMDEDAYATHARTNKNDLAFYYDDSAGSITGTPYKVICGGGNFHRPSGTGDSYHNWQVPTVSITTSGDMGTYDPAGGVNHVPGRGGPAGATRIANHGLMVKQNEYDAAIANATQTNPTIPHALSLLLWGSPHLSRSSNGYRWPAYSADNAYDSDASNSGSYNGTIPGLRAGALLCLPARLTQADAVSGDLDLLDTALQTDFSRFLRALAEALYRYGGYVSDNTAWASYGLTVEADSIPRGFTTAQKNALIGLFTRLELVDSNGPTAVGGANTNRRT